MTLAKGYLQFGTTHCVAKYIISLEGKCFEQVVPCRSVMLKKSVLNYLCIGIWQNVETKGIAQGDQYLTFPFSEST